MSGHSIKSVINCCVHLELGQDPRQVGASAGPERRLNRWPLLAPLRVSCLEPRVARVAAAAKQDGALDQNIKEPFDVRARDGSACLMPSLIGFDAV